MVFDFAAAAVPVDEPVRAAFREEWDCLAAPGTWFTGAERVGIAAEARAARAFADAGTDLPPAVVEAAHSVAAAAPYIIGEWVEDLRARGVSLEAYVEIIGVVSRLAAVDTYCYGVGAALEALPAPVPGEPSRQRVADARHKRMFVPTAGEDRAGHALTSVPAEGAGCQRIGATLYLDDAAMGDLTYQGVLSRAQMELVAVRVSYLNECFY